MLFLIKNSKTKNPIVENVFKMEGEHWWLTGFLFNIFTNVNASPQNKLAMIASVDLKDESFANAYLNNLKNQNNDEILSIERCGSIVLILWDDVRNIVKNKYFRHLFK